jgi:hypothetical protein
MLAILVMYTISARSAGSGWPQRRKSPSPYQPRDRCSHLLKSWSLQARLPRDSATASDLRLPWSNSRATNGIARTPPSFLTLEAIENKSWDCCLDMIQVPSHKVSDDNWAHQSPLPSLDLSSRCSSLSRALSPKHASELAGLRLGGSPSGSLENRL